MYFGVNICRSEINKNSSPKDRREIEIYYCIISYEKLIVGFEKRRKK